MARFTGLLGSHQAGMKCGKILAPMRRAFLILLATALFAVVAPAQRAADVRRLPLEGAPNFRDLGGYATGDGKHVRWGQVYRSGHLAQLTEKDYKYLAGLGIRTVCDFRNDVERQVNPTHWQGPNPPEILSLPALKPGRSGREVGAGASPAEVAANMHAIYERIVVESGSSYRAVLQRILHGSGPTLLHCSAGKDRTGAFSAVLLLLLGAPRETVFEDYLLTNRYVGTPEQVAATAGGLKASPEGVRALLIADRGYLETALQAIDRKFGSLDNYRRTELGLSDQDLARLKARLLEN